jgi:hypothetical protein
VARGTIGWPEQRILEALSLFDQLTAEQLSRLLDYSFRYTQDRCKALYDRKYLQRLTLPKRTPGGGVPYVYTLGRKGRNYLKELDEEAAERLKSRYRPSDETARLHTLATNEVLLQVRKITKTDPSLSLVRTITEREFQNEPIKVTLPDSSGPQTVSLIPDLWLHLRHRVETKTYTHCFCIEVNLTSVEQRRWRRKVAMYLNCAEGYKKRVGSSVLQVVTIINGPATVLRRGAGSYSEQEQKARMADMRASEKTKADYITWTEKELTLQNKQDEADLFLFTSAPLDTFTPQDLLFSEQFVQPFDTGAVPLIPS